MKHFSLLIALVMAAVLFTTTISSGTVLAKTASSGKQCQIALDRLHPGERVSRVLSYQCVEGSQQLVAPPKTVLLMTWYKDDHYRGASTRIYGYEGPCDASGYGIPYVGDDWRDISSFKVYNNCAYTRGYTGKNYGGDCNAWYLNTTYVGDYFNDRIRSFWLSSISLSCR